MGTLYVILNQFGEGSFLGVYDDKDLAVNTFKEWYKEEEGYDLDDPNEEYCLVEHEDCFTVELRIPEEDEFGLDYGDVLAILKTELNQKHNKFVGG